MKLFVGIDVSLQKLDVCFLDSDQNILDQPSLTNDLNGARAIKELVLKLSSATHYKRVVIGMESTSIYSFHPAMFFHEDPELNALPLDVVTLNPTMIHRYKGLFDEDKTDTIDAFRIADFLRIERYQVPVIKEEKYVALQRLTRTRYQLIHQMTECKQHFLENLYYKCNTLTQEIPTSVFSSSIMDILSDSLSLDEISQMNLEDLAARLNKAGKGRFSNPEKLAKVIQKAIRDSYRIGKVLQNSVDVVLATYARIIAGLKKQIQTLDKSIESLYAIIPEAQSLMSVPGIGPVYTAGLLAEIGQIDRFDNEAQLAKYAGLYWKVSQSGNFQAERTPRTRTGNEYLRYYLIEAANSVKRCDPVYRAYYQKKFNEVPKFRHKRALVLTARKLVRLVDVLLRDHLIYTPKGGGLADNQ
ncbi:IS110 family transposase [Sporolactobacillus putidus]|uniref:IS110 family transposase n=1 Tax=Sporolactobacillus putidus TaxID=492735 RepID=A0A917W5V9_9BACL|nr:IS110 family transposase [Sporolactobacillus putidus]GGL66029.1 IS110 family transposase [Sporolactobacillus putidus]